MGTRWTRRLGRRQAVAGFILGALTVAATGCDSNGDVPPPPEVTPAEAYVAVIHWELEQHVPVIDEDGNDQPLVIYLAAQAGATVDIGVQAEVVEATADDATIRFSDESSQAIDEGLDHRPVKDDGVMFIVGDLTLGAATIETVVRRYQSIDDDATYDVKIVASIEGAKVITATNQDDDTT